MTTKTVVISDIHIGDNSPTCWYQAKYHEEKLAAILQAILDHPDSYSELVILGDLLDFWTYPPHVSPPTVDRLVAANRKILGSGGALERVAQALKGNVIYLHGNHDLTMTQDDLDKLSPNQQIRLETYDPFVLDRYGAGVALTHGHNYCIFNAPDLNSPLAPLPVGHFVTRMIAYHLWQNPDIRSGKVTAADLRAQGGPDGWTEMVNLPSVAELWDLVSKPNFAGQMLQRFASLYSVPQDQPFKLSNGTVTLSEVYGYYDGLWTQWVQKFGGGDFGQSTAYKAVWADMTGDYMGWFAQKIAMEEGADGIIMGHTHVPKAGVQALNNYVNAGFECPAVSDSDKPFTFALLNWHAENGGSVELAVQKVVPGVGGTFRFEPVSAPPDEIVGSSALDFSCYVEIVNRRTSELVLRESGAQSGHWVVTPPRVVLGGVRRGFWIQDEGLLQQLKGLSLSGLSGTQGWASYRNEDGSGQFTLNFHCPTGVLPNSATASSSDISIRVKTGDGDWSSSPTWFGRPLVIEYTVR